MSAFVYVNSQGEALPATSLQGLNAVGFFLSDQLSGSFQICNDQPISIWVDGELEYTLSGCDTLSVEGLRDLGKTKNTFVNIHSRSGLDKLMLYQLKDTAPNKVTKGEKRKRPSSDHFDEFVLMGLIALMVFAGWLSTQYSNRISYLLNRTFSLKFNTYEFANTQLFSTVGISFCLFASMLLAFFYVYNLRIATSGTALELLGEWGQTALYISLFLLAKWINSVVVSRLFNYKLYYEYQLFDFVNLIVIVSIISFFPVVLDLVFDWSDHIFVTQSLRIIFASTLVISIVFIGLKFVNNTTSKKLPIISYLCATEIIPAIIIVGRFFK